MRLAIGIGLAIVGMLWTVGAVVHALRYPRRAIADIGFWTVMQAARTDGWWAYLLPVFILIVGVMIVVTELAG